MGKEFQNKKDGSSAADKGRIPEEKPTASLPNSLVQRSMAESDIGTDAAPIDFRHESSHTIRRHTNPVQPLTSTPSGVIQREGPNDAAPVSTQQAQVQPAAGNASGGIAALETAVLNQFQTKPFGEKTYKDIEGKIKDWIKIGAGRRKTTFTPERGTRFMVRALYRDYLTKDILESVAKEPINTKQQMNERSREYRALIKEASERSSSYEMEDIAEQTDLLPGGQGGNAQPGSRAYEEQVAAGATFSTASVSDRGLQKFYAVLDQAQTPEEAYKSFAAFTGNKKAKLQDKRKEFKDPNFDMDSFRTRLKQMARMVRDYPELRNKIGDMYAIDKKSLVSMETTKTFTKGGYKADIGLNPGRHQGGIFGRFMRAAQDASDAQHGYRIAPGEFDGTHELGHVLSGTLADTEDRPDFNNMQQNLNVFENRVLSDAIKHNTSDIDSAYPGLRDNIRRYGASFWGPQGWVKGQIYTQEAFQDAGATSGYGSENAGEFFAEAFADVYAHGASAKPMSKKIVQEYEAKQKKKQQDQFEYDKLSGWQKFLRFFTGKKK